MWFSDCVIGAWKATTKVSSFFVVVNDTSEKSEFLEPLIEFFTLLLRKLRPKNNKIIS